MELLYLFMLLIQYQLNSMNNLSNLYLYSAIVINKTLHGSNKPNNDNDTNKFITILIIVMIILLVIAILLFIRDNF